MNTGIRTICTIFIAACLGVVLFSAIAHGAKKMEPSYLYDIKEAIVLEPQVLYVSTSSNLSLFPVPQDNAIGTNDLNNAITIISFPKGKIDYDKYFKNAYEQVGGGGEFIPVISSDIIGFGQTRRFVLYNFKTKKHERFRIAASIEESIQKIAIANAWQKHFIFELKGYDKKSEDHSDYTSNLQLIDLSGQEPRLIKQINIGSSTTWTVIFDKVFLYDIDKEQFKVLTTNFEQANHPLADVIKQNKGKINFTRIHPHPSLPFAILEAGRKDEVLVSWGQGRDKTPTSIFGKGTTVTQFSFSPDGNWLVFKKESLNENKTYLMSISEKYPHFLGSPIQIFNHYFNENNFGWTNHPVSFVGSSLDKLYRWDLENRDFPGKGKLSFHDYIVQ